MKITFRIIMIGVAVLGLGFGASFGAGIAYGRSTPKEAATTPTQQQLNSQLGVTTGGTGAAGGTAAQQAAIATAAAGGGARAGAGGGAAAGALAARNTTGKITAIDGRTITVETRTGSVRVTLAQTGVVEKVSAGALGDLKVGDTIFATGSRQTDGSFDATNVSQIPTELQTIVAAIGAASPAATATPTGR